MSLVDKLWEWLLAVGDGNTAWMLQIFVIVFAALLFNFVVRILLNRLHARLRTTHNPWDDALVDALRPPLTLLIWVVGIAYAAEIVGREAEADVFNVIHIVRAMGVIVALTWFLIRLVRRVEANIISYREADGKPVDRTTIDAIAKLVRVSILITAALVTMQTLGLNISAVLAFGGIGGIAVGFAARDLLANFFGGLTIYLDRPFVVGNWVRSADGQIEGVVEEIGWRLTCVRQFDKRPIYVPNATFTNISVVNPSRMTHRRIYEVVGVRYDDAAEVRGIVSDVKQMLMAHPELDQTQTTIVNFNEFAASSLNLFIYCFTRTTVWAEYHAVKEDVLLKVLDIITAHGAEVAFPTSTIHVPGAVRLDQKEPGWDAGSAPPGAS